MKNEEVIKKENSDIRSLVIQALLRSIESGSSLKTQKILVEDKLNVTLIKINDNPQTLIIHAVENKSLTNNSDSLPDNNISLPELERISIIKTLKKVKGNKQKAAELLDISRRSLYNKLEDYNIDENEYTD